MRRRTKWLVAACSLTVGFLAGPLPFSRYALLLAVVVAIAVICAREDVCEHADPPREAGPGLDADLLARAYAEIEDEYPASITAGRDVADIMRSNLGDLDDVTLGRVALELGQLMGHLSQCPGCAPLSVVDVLAAGLELTALEWQTAGDS